MKKVFNWFNSGLSGTDTSRSRLTFAAVAAVAAALSGCSNPGPEGAFYDPLEPQNRAVHQFNKTVDKALVRPTANAYGTVVPKPVKQGVINFADNLSMPNRFLNNVLQFDVEAAAITTLRFMSNTLFGLGGILDVASDMGLPDEDTDFGETLHAWNVGEGAYVEVPLYGPNTARGTVGLVVDILLLDPLGQVLPNDTDSYRTTVWALDKLGDRHRYADLIDELLYESVDSYATERSYYLQSRRFELSKELTEADLEDPYAQ